MVSLEKSMQVEITVCIYLTILEKDIILMIFFDVVLQMTFNLLFPCFLKSPYKLRFSFIVYSTRLILTKSETVLL